MRFRMLATAAVALALASCASERGPITVDDARIGRPAGSTAALYLTVDNDGEADRLIGARTEAADSVEMHESVIAGDGTASMRPVLSMELPAGGSLVLEPGGLHLMLVDVDPLEIGDRVEVVLQWESADDITVLADVVNPSETMGHDHG